jgi:hypothetical protein
VHLHSSNGEAGAAHGRTPLATATRLAALGGYSGFFISSKSASAFFEFERHPVLDAFSFLPCIKEDSQKTKFRKGKEK